MAVSDDTQEYEVTVSFKYTGKIYEGDPEDRFDLAGFEEDDIEQLLLNHFDECTIKNIKVVPVIAPGE